MKVSQARPRSRRVLNQSLLVLGATTLAAGLGGMTLAPGLSAASSHREAPLIAGDPRADNTDVYAFTSPDKADTVTMVANWIPMEEPNGGPNFYAFGDDLRYNIKIDNSGDGVADVTYSWRFRSSYRDDANQFLYNTGQVTSLNDPDLNFRQVYDLVVTAGGKSRTLLSGVPAAPSRTGQASMPDYAALRKQATFGLPGGGKTYTGQAEDPFFADLRVFDLLYGGDLSERGQDTLAGYNVNTIAIQVPKKQLALKGNSSRNPVIGVWSTTDRAGVTVADSRDQKGKGGTKQWKQVSRLGNPLVNEVVVPLKFKDAFNTLNPSQDRTVQPVVDKVYDPILPKLIQQVYGIPAPATPRNDLAEIYLTGICKVCGPIKADLNAHRLNKDAALRKIVPAEELRLNMAVPPTARPQRLGVLAGDLAGFPNGRRLADDVVDISLQAVEGAAQTGVLVPELADGDKVNANEVPFGASFPYVALPHTKNVNRGPGGGGGGRPHRRAVLHGEHRGDPGHEDHPGRRARRSRRPASRRRRLPPPPSRQGQLNRPPVGDGHLTRCPGRAGERPAPARPRPGHRGSSSIEHSGGNSVHPDHTEPPHQPPPPSPGGRRLRNIVVTLTLGAAMFAAGAVMLAPDQTTASRPSGQGRPGASPPRGSIEALQARVTRLPKDPGGWAALGMAYVQQARSTADPATYDRAEKALRTSFRVQAEDNTDAEIGMGALSAARHDFPTALRWARKATTSGPYSSSAYGVLADAYTQLGRYEEADEAVQKMTDLRPDAASLARASYAFELKGDTDRARALMRRSLAAAATRADTSFAHNVLATLDLQDADPRAALARTRTGLSAAPGDSALLETRARAHTALGNTTKAIADYRAAIAIAPLPHYLLGLGELEQSLGHREQAEAQYTLLRAQDRIRAAAGDPADTDAILFEADHGAPRRAVTMAEQTLRTRPFIAVHDAYAWALHRAGRDAEALVQADKALATGARSALFHYHRAAIHHALGDTEAARRDLTQALREPGFHPLHADAARDLLQRIDTTS